MRWWSVRAGGTALAVLAMIGLAAGPAVAAAGAPGGGDPYFPLQGNGGYEVDHYGLQLRYSPATRQLQGVVRIDATAMRSVGAFDLDLRRNMTVSSVVVDGRRAAFRQPASLVQELVVTPARGLRKGHHFRVVVTYAGRPQIVTDPDDSIEGWVETPDGAFTVNEPQGSPSWFPCNDSPRDKATYDFLVTVPQGVTAIANGTLLSKRTKHGWSTFRWSNREPMSTYLSTVTTGRFDVRTGRTPARIPFYIATDPALTAQSAAVLSKLPEITDYFALVYGRYPFSSVGAVVDDAPQVGYALEVQTKPLFDSPPDELTLAHELAHMWFGDAVTLARWRDIWLNEGFAEFSSWLWSEHAGGETAQEFFDEFFASPADSDVWTPPSGDPGGPADLFDTSIYERGAMTLQALRVKLGDPTFFRVMRDWFAAHRFGNATVPEFTRFASRVSHRDLANFFDVWLFQPGKPTSF